MCDYGLDPAGVMNTIALSGLDVGKLITFSLSHGHDDNSASAMSILKQDQLQIVAGKPCYLGAEAFAREMLAPSRRGRTCRPRTAKVRTRRVACSFQQGDARNLW
jgi:hypothetical protein